MNLHEGIAQGIAILCSMLCDGTFFMFLGHGKEVNSFFIIATFVLKERREEREG